MLLTQGSKWIKRPKRPDRKLNANFQGALQGRAQWHAWPCAVKEAK